MKIYRTIDHTADLGIEIAAASLAGLFETAAAAMFDQIVDPATVRGRAAGALEVTGADPADLMVNWLRELLYLWAGEAKVVKAARVTGISETAVAASVRYDAFDARRHRVRREIKAVTYHQIRVARRAGGGWSARVIFDV